jgi:pantoate kinase
LPSLVRAYAPSAVTNFFRIEYDSVGVPCGASGGGYILSKGTTSTATFGSEDRGDRFITVNEDASFDARTTRAAIRLMAEASEVPPDIMIAQKVEAPIGAGFGSSAAGALSAVYAAAPIFGLKATKEGLAMFAHRAEIQEQTGLGTVSVIYAGSGAGAITRAGDPGKAEFLNVKVPADVYLVTAYLAPLDKKAVLASSRAKQKVDALGERALRAFVSDPTLETLGEEGERFSSGLGLESPEVKKLIAAAKREGAMHASQNMLGHSVHALVDAERVPKVARSFSTLGARADVFGLHGRTAGLLPSAADD